MSASTYNILMIVAFALSGVFLITAVILFFKLGIKSAMDELSGKRARKQVAEIRKENTSVKGRGYAAGIFERGQTKNTDSLSKESGRLKKNTSRLSEKEITEKMDELIEEAGGTVVLSDPSVNSIENEGTTVLGSSFEEEEGTTILVDAEEGTTLLTDDSGGTEITNKCEVIREIVVLESKDYIEVD